MRKFKLLAALYLVGVILTFGVEANRLEREATNSIEYAFATPLGLCIALVWPGYWPLRTSYLMFQHGSK